MGNGHSAKMFAPTEESLAGDCLISINTTKAPVVVTGPSSTGAVAFYQTQSVVDRLSGQAATGRCSEGR
jgi:hypothetical protein